MFLNGDETDNDFFYVSQKAPGEVYLKKSLSGTSRSNFRFSVRANDDRPLSVRKTADATVEITVLRDSGPPTFTNTPYNTIVPINQVVNSTFYNVRAIDGDLKVSVHFMIFS